MYLLINIQKLKIKNERGILIYIGDTKILYESLKGTEEGEIEFHRELKRNKERWENVQIRLKELIDFKKKTLDKLSFYPPKFANGLIELGISLDKIKDIKEKNPLASEKEYDEMIHSKSTELEEYVKTKKKVEDLIPVLTMYEERLTDSDEKFEFNLKKQELYLSLHSGNIDHSITLYEELKKISSQGA